MLGTFRENARSWLATTILGAIIVVFVLSFGAGSRGLRSTVTAGSPWAARIEPGDHEIPGIAFQEAYAAQVARMQQYGMGTEEQLKQFKIRESLMTELEDMELAAEAAEKSGIFVSDEELAQEVAREGRFDDPATNKFDPEIYKSYTDHVESAKSYEERTRRRLMAQRETELLTGGIVASDDEIRDAWLKEEEGASIAFVKFLPGSFRDQVQVSPADIDAVLKDRAGEVQKRFDDSKMLYTEPRAVKARRLFVPVKQDATPQDEAAAKKKIDDAFAALKAGKKWEELQPQFASDPVTGGDLGWVQLGRSTLGRQTEEAVFKLKPGEMAQTPLRDRFGFAILQALDERAPSEKKFDDVKRDIAADLVKEANAKGLAKAAAEKALAALKAGQSLETQYPKAEKPAQGQRPDPAAAKTLHTVVTDEFHPGGGTIPQAGSVPKISALVFSLDADKRSPDSVIEEQNAFWVIELKSRTRADMSKFDAMKGELREKVESDKRNELRRLWTEKLRKDVKIEENPDFVSYEHKARGQPDDS